MSDDVLTHFDEAGRAHMVDVGDKPVTRRCAVAIGRVTMAPKTVEAINEGRTAKGNVLAVARIAGITGAKRTADLIPLCHPLPLTRVSVEFAPTSDGVWVRATAECRGRTGVEMEALTAATVAGLTIYDMCKAIDREMAVGPFVLAEKSGGRSGHFVRSDAADWPTDWL